MPSEHSSQKGLTVNLIAPTPKPPYYTVIFTSIKAGADDGYGEMAEKMLSLATQQPGFLGIESARDNLGITVSYWENLESIKAWKSHIEHQKAQTKGKDVWYSAYKVRITKVEKEYGTL